MIKNSTYSMLTAALLLNSSWLIPTDTLAANPISKSPSSKIVTLYLLIDTPEQLQQYVADLKKITKPNFNRIIFSFVKPTMPNYVTGNLAHTGILGYFDAGDGKGVQAFNQLKEAVALSKQKNIQTFLSVGGWNYSCNAAVFSCGPANDT